MMNKTYAPNPKNIDTAWHHIDAEGKVLGRVASDIAKLIMGKHKPTFAPNQNVGDKVVVTNAGKVVITGNKAENKVYYRHTTYPGGIKSETYEKLLERRPTEVLRKAVYGMLPKNKLRDVRIKNLHIYASDTHPHGANLKGNN